MKKVFVREDTN